MKYAVRVACVLLSMVMVTACEHAQKADPPWQSGAMGAIPEAQPPPQVIRSTVTCPDGSVVTIAAFAGPVTYALHNGTQDPGPLAAHFTLTGGPAISADERGELLAAFNGGFKMVAHDGGYLQEGHVIEPLRAGLASLVIDRSGQARIGVWGRTVPLPGEAVYSVRQNLWPLVQDGKPTAESRLWWRWGGTIGHKEYVARSAIGQNDDGELIYAGSMRATPADLAFALVKAGAVTGMQMDINPYWVMLGVASRPGGPLVSAVPGQMHPSSVYLTGWYRDFITVLASP